MNNANREKSLNWLVNFRWNSWTKFTDRKLWKKKRIHFFSYTYHRAMSTVNEFISKCAYTAFIYFSAFRISIFQSYKLNTHAETADAEQMKMFSFYSAFPQWNICKLKWFVFQLKANSNKWDSTLAQAAKRETPYHPKYITLTIIVFIFFKRTSYFVKWSDFRGGKLKLGHKQECRWRRNNRKKCTKT